MTIGDSLKFQIFLSFFFLFSGESKNKMNGLLSIEKIASGLITFSKSLSTLLENTPFQLSSTIVKSPFSFESWSLSNICFKCLKSKYHFLNKCPFAKHNLFTVYFFCEANKSQISTSKIPTILYNSFK